MNSLTTNIKAILSVMVIALVFAYFFYCSIAKVQPDPQILIAVVGASGTVLGFWFGSSSGSAKKDDALITAANNPTVSNADTVNVDQTTGK